MSSTRATDEQLESEVFGGDHPSTDEQRSEVIEQYKMMLGTIESLEGRRQALHTFFMSINSLLLAAIGLVAKESLDEPAVSAGVILLATMGAAFSVCWTLQIASHGTVLASKWEVFNHMERALPSRPFSAEYECMQRRGYRSFTRIESLVPLVFTALYAVSLVGGVLLATDVL